MISINSTRASSPAMDPGEKCAENARTASEGTPNMTPPANIEPRTEAIDDPLQGMITLTHVIYGLHALSALAGLTSAAFIVTAFLSGWPSIIAVILNYLKRGEVRGTWLESHFRWQIRTFWYTLLWFVCAGLLAVTLIGIPAALLLMLGAGIWVIYRIARGWLSLSERKAMPFKG